jgi:phosphoglycerol transferase MdoB-like AlkP superfamily enzyme
MAIQNSGKGQRHLLIRLLSDLFILPCLVLAYLSLPRLYAALTYGEWNELFTSSFLNLNLDLAYLLAAGYFVGRQFFCRSSKLIFLLVLQLLFCIRIADIEMIRIFHMSFSPAFFANIELEAFKVMVSNYWLEMILLVLYLPGSFGLLFRIRFSSYGKLGTSILTIVFILVFVRSIYILKKERWHSSADFASQLLIEQAYDYYLQSDILQSLNWSKAEREVVEELGFELEPVKFDFDSSTLKKFNLIIVYLEGFQNGFTSIGGSRFKNLTPNLDRFAERHLYLPNYYNAVTPTINALISTQCGLLPRFGNHSLDKIVYAPDIGCLSDYLHHMGYQQVMLLGSSPVFSGIKKFAEFHLYDEIIGRYKIESQYPDFEKATTSWGINDFDLFKVAVDTIEKLKERPPFHLTLFTLDTHPPFDTSPECPVFSKENKMLNAIHCSDHAFGMFYDYLRKEDLLKSSIVLLTGDHMIHGGGREFGKVFTALHVPGLNAMEGQTIEAASYSPDIIATLLELMGTGLNEKLAGKSFMSVRQQYQHLISPGFELYNKKFIPSGDCSREDLQKTVLADHDHPFSNCEREKAIKLLDARVFRGKFGKATPE